MHHPAGTLSDRYQTYPDCNEAWLRDPKQWEKEFWHRYHVRKTSPLIWTRFTTQSEIIWQTKRTPFTSGPDHRQIKHTQNTRVNMTTWHRMERTGNKTQVKPIRQVKTQEAKVTSNRPEHKFQNKTGNTKQMKMTPQWWFVKVAHRWTSNFRRVTFTCFSHSCQGWRQEPIFTVRLSVYSLGSMSGWCGWITSVLQFVLKGGELVYT